MKEFNDNEGRSWSVKIDVTAIKRVKESPLGINLLDVIGGELLEKLYTDPVLLCDVIYVVCKPQADERGVSDEEFGRAMWGDPIEKATVALLEEIVNFSPNPQDRANLQRVLAKTVQTLDRGRDLMAEQIDGGALDRKMDSILKEQERRLSTVADATNTSGSAPESSASTRDRSP